MEVPINERCWHEAPLVAVLDKTVGPLRPESGQSQTGGKGERVISEWRRGFLNWKRCVALLASSDRSQSFLKSLSIEQSTSLRLLQEWLDGDYQPMQLAKAALQVIEDGDYEITDEMDLSDSTFPSKAKTNQSVYHNWMGRLFRYEFTLLDWDWRQEFIKLVRDMLKSTRQRVLYLATSQRIAWLFYSANSRKSLTGNINLYTAPLGREACPWLVIGRKSEELPYFLWDIKNSITVSTRDLGYIPDYTCISHTWGRWPKSVPCVVDGVPWKVPQNRIFDVCELPRQFHEGQSQLGTSFVWFDLFCIPQVQETVEYEELARHEIANQARIFVHATKCIAWFSYIPSWAGEIDAISWISHCFLASTSAPRALEIRAFDISADRRIRFFEPPVIEDVEHSGLFKVPAGLESDEYARSPWFSSLWTLQEMFLRPDMLLMNKMFEPLSTPDGLMLSLDQIHCLLDTTMYSNSTTSNESYVDVERDDRFIIEHFSSVPDCVTQLYDWSTQCALNKSHYTASGPPQILILANERDCTSRRAEAIMSILGVTEWFKESTLEDKLVLGVYPLRFLQEAASKLGPGFYYFLKYLDLGEVSGCLTNGEVKGSLLPFEEILPGHLHGKQTMVSFPIHQTSTSPYRETTQDWHLQDDGSVRITRAAILAISDFSVQPSENCVISVSSLDENTAEGMQDKRIDVTTWLKKQRKDDYICLVNLTPEQGIVLKGVILKQEPRRMVKIGCYYRHTVDVINVELPLVIPVDYLVV